MEIKGKKGIKTNPTHKTTVLRNKPKATSKTSKKKVKKKPAIKSKKSSQLLPKSTQSQKIPGDCFLLPKNQRELYKLQKKWDKILKEQGFEDIEFRQSNGQMSEFIKKPLYERHQNKIPQADINDYINNKTNSWQEYRNYYYSGQFYSFADKFIFYCYYQLELSYVKIRSIISSLQTNYPPMNELFTVKLSNREITESLKRSRKLKAILFP